MTYSFVQNAINTEVFPGGTEIFDRSLMTGRGRGKYCYRTEAETFLREQIREIFDESRQLFGAGKIRAVLMARGQKVSEKLVVELMREMGICSLRSSSKRDYERMQSYEKKENILKRQFQVDEPNRVWVSDVTWFRLKTRWYYICVVIDLFSRKVVAHNVTKSNSARLITTTLKLALADRKPNEGLVFHSDQGTQYTAYAFHKLLAKHHITQSLSKPGTPHDNAVAESFFAGFKTVAFRVLLTQSAKTSRRKFQTSKGIEKPPHPCVTRTRRHRKG